MRWKSSIISFLLTLTTSVVVVERQAVADWLWPSFSRIEVEHIVGRRVRYRQTAQFIGMKCPADGFCKRIADGEQGAIVGLELVRAGGYFLLVRWDEPHHSENYLSYFGRYTRRESLIE